MNYEKEITHPIVGELAETLIKVKKPMICGVNGVALGGGLELVLSMDTVVASENARIGLPEMSLGLTPGIGGT